jgi:UPF0716 protein FxsA
MLERFAVRTSWFALLILLLPVAEIAGFILVGEEIGVLATLALIFATSFLGILLLRVQGFGLLARIRSETEQGRVPGREMVHGLMIMIAGILLLLPGFITDLLGLLLFIPAVRDLGWSLLKSRIVVAGTSYPPSPAERIVDLEDSEYRREPRPDTPWRPE